MSLNAALSIATGGLANIERQLGLASQNIANASTPGYSVETATQSSFTAGGVGMGVRSGAVTRLTDAALQAQTRQQTTKVADLTTRQTALRNIDAVQGTPGQGTDLASLLGALGNHFSTLLNQPSSQTAQNAVVGAANTLTTMLNTLSDTVTAQRGQAQAGLSTSLTDANAALAQIGALSDQIINLKSDGQSTADLENQRDRAVNTLSALIGAKTLPAANGDLLVLTRSGLTLPTRAPTGPFSLADGYVGPDTSYNNGTLPGVMLGGQDVTTQLQDGKIGANIALRDTVLPAYQAGLDAFADTITSRFAAQGLTLFTDPTGSQPTSSVGYAATIKVNPAISAIPTLVRDGTNVVAGSITGASAFTPNPPNGPAGFSALIERVLTYALGTQVQAGVAQPQPATTGLGPAGNLRLPFGPPASLSEFASALVSSQAGDSAAVTSQLDTATAVQTSLTSKLSSETGVNMDTEMAAVVALQNAYAMNARIISVAQTMWNQLLSAAGA